MDSSQFFSSCYFVALQSEHTTIKQALEQQQERYGALQTEHSQLLEHHQQNKQLITQLEADLSMVRPLLPTGDVSVTHYVKTIATSILTERCQLYQWQLT